MRDIDRDLSRLDNKRQPKEKFVDPDTCDNCDSEWFYSHDSYGKLCEDCYDIMVDKQRASLGFPKGFRSHYDLRTDNEHMLKLWKMKRYNNY